VDNRIAPSFHGRKNTFALVEKRSIQKKVLMCGEFHFFGGRMLKPILDDPSNATDTVTALSCDLSHRIALNNPALKPNTFSHSFILSVVPNESATACTTAKALAFCTTFSMLSNLSTAAMRTMLFCSSSTTIVERLQQ
jgi:hypothetical protein